MFVVKAVHAFAGRSKRSLGERARDSSLLYESAGRIRESPARNRSVSERYPREVRSFETKLWTRPLKRLWRYAFVHHSIPASFHRRGTGILQWSNISHNSFVLRLRFDLTMALRFAMSSMNAMRTGVGFRASPFQADILRLHGLSGRVVDY